MFEYLCVGIIARRCEVIVLKVQGTLQGVESFPKSLKSLYLRETGDVTDGSLENISTLTSLTSLDLSECQGITDAGLGHVSRLTSLKSLNLSSCYQITDAGLAHLSTLTSL
eukprot:PhF_6_TR32153/c3_g2_i2/m.47683